MTPFEKSAVEAENRGDRETARRIRVEGKMAETLVDALLERNYLVTVDSGEDEEIVKSSNKEEIMNSMFSTDEDMVLFYLNDKDEYCTGWFLLVYGNDGWDVVSDYLSNGDCDEIWEKVISPMSDALESGRNL